MQHCPLLLLFNFLFQINGTSLGWRVGQDQLSFITKDFDIYSS